MKTTTLDISSTHTFELINITDKVQKNTTDLGFENGIVITHVPHTTATLICNEDEARLREDILTVVSSLQKHASFFGGFSHDAEEGNAHAHIMSSIIGNTKSFIIEDGQLLLGTWQSILFLEMDGPRARKIHLKYIID